MVKNHRMHEVSSGPFGPVRGSLCWVESTGGPLVVVPLSAQADWAGSSQSWGRTGVREDYDRACDVEGLAGVLAVGTGGARALVLGDEPASSCFVPDLRAFVRWLGADSEAELLAMAEAVIADPATVWEDCGVWETDGAAVLMDAVIAGNELDVGYPGGGALPEQAPVPVEAGRWRVSAAYVDGDDASVGVVRLLPAA